MAARPQNAWSSFPSECVWFAGIKSTLSPTWNLDISVLYMEEVVAVVHHRSHYQIIVAGIICEPPILHHCLFELIALLEASGGYIHSTRHRQSTSNSHLPG